MIIIFVIVVCSAQSQFPFQIYVFTLNEFATFDDRPHHLISDGPRPLFSHLGFFSADLYPPAH